MCADSSIAVVPKNVIDEHGAFLNNRRTPTTPDFGVWVEGNRILLYLSNCVYQYNKSYGLLTASLPL
jgi:hypothetical protein